MPTRDNRKHFYMSLQTDYSFLIHKRRQPPEKSPKLPPAGLYIWTSLKGSHVWLSNNGKHDVEKLKNHKVRVEAINNYGLIVKNF